MMDCRPGARVETGTRSCNRSGGSFGDGLDSRVGSFYRPSIGRRASRLTLSKRSLACGRCHVNAAGGGARTSFGNAFLANGHKVPSKGAKPGQKAGDATPVSTETGHPPATHQSIRGTASVFYTTSPGVSNHSATFECFNCGVFVDPH